MTLMRRGLKQAMLELENIVTISRYMQFLLQMFISLLHQRSLLNF